MFEKIVLPLDGSELAEQALPYVRDLAGKLGAEVHLIHVCPPGHATLTRMHSVYLGHAADTLRKGIADAWGLAKPSVSAEVIAAEQPAPAILDYVKQHGVGLVAVTTCGASGLRVWAVGSVADKVVRNAEIPTLLVRVSQDRPAGKNGGLIRRILLPLDSSEASRVAVQPGTELARRLGASITLFSMAETIYAQNLDGMGMSVGVNWDQVDASTQKYLDDYLSSIESEIRTAGVEVSHKTVIGIDAASEILELEKKIPADLIVMATRGRSPIARWALGSTAEKVLREGNVPLLLVREKVEAK